jgi:hypothetical protein
MGARDGLTVLMPRVEYAATLLGAAGNAGGRILHLLVRVVRRWSSVSIRLSFSRDSRSFRQALAALSASPA